jgi:hypothetical protein
MKSIFVLSFLVFSTIASAQSENANPKYIVSGFKTALGVPSVGAESDLFTYEFGIANGSLCELSLDVRGLNELEKKSILQDPAQFQSIDFQFEQAANLRGDVNWTVYMVSNKNHFHLPASLKCSGLENTTEVIPAFQNGTANIHFVRFDRDEELNLFQTIRKKTQ